MPKGSDTMTEGKVLKWIKHEGDAVANGDTIVEIETDKVDMEVESMGEGRLRKILVKEGEVVPVGQLLAVVAAESEDIAAMLEAARSKPAAQAHESHAALAPEEVKPSSAPPAQAPATPTNGAPTATPAPIPIATGGRVLASPLARKMAQENGIDLNRLMGTGPGGRIIRQDVDRALVSASLIARAQKVPPQPRGVSALPVGAPSLPSLPPPPLPGGPDFRDEPLSQMRKTIATRLSQSLGPVPHFYLTIEVDMRRAKELRESANALDPNLKLSYNDIILKACTAALRLHPEVNASFLGDKIRAHNRVHIGMAVAVDGGGLITPVIRDCDRKTMQEISREAKDLIARARNRKLQPDEYTGATFSVSNLGMMGIDEFSAVINPPEGAILAVGAVVEKPVVFEHRIEIGFRCRMTLSCDHRVVDGATGARFLQSLQQILENPVYLAF
jgi:pyruvate dehydrogenase E2 component (dihydrolipoyllysine-residue acetyltransferase)